MCVGPELTSHAFVIATTNPMLVHSKVPQRSQTWCMDYELWSFLHTIIVVTWVSLFVMLEQRAYLVHCAEVAPLGNCRAVADFENEVRR